MNSFTTVSVIDVVMTQDIEHGFLVPLGVAGLNTRGRHCSPVDGVLARVRRGIATSNMRSTQLAESDSLPGKLTTVLANSTLSVKCVYPNVATTCC